MTLINRKENGDKMGGNTKDLLCKTGKNLSVTTPVKVGKLYDC